MSSLASMVFWGAVAYFTLGFLVLRLWFRRRASPRPASLHEAPDAWLAYWLPQLIAAQTWLLIGVAPLSFLLPIVAPYSGDAGAAMPPVVLAVGETAMFAAAFAVYDAVMIIRARRTARRQH